MFILTLSDYRLLKKEKPLSTLNGSEIVLFKLPEEGYNISNIQNPQVFLHQSHDRFLKRLFMNLLYCYC